MGLDQQLFLGVRLCRDYHQHFEFNGFQSCTIIYLLSVIRFVIRFFFRQWLICWSCFKSTWVGFSICRKKINFLILFSAIVHLTMLCVCVCVCLFVPDCLFGGWFTVSCVWCVSSIVATRLFIHVMFRLLRCCVCAFVLAICVF